MFKKWKKMIESLVEENEALKLESQEKCAENDALRSELQEERAKNAKLNRVLNQWTIAIGYSEDRKLYQACTAIMLEILGK